MTANDTSPESDIQLKKRARRRLVGASALALLAVIVLPMVMDREPRPALQDIQVRIPAQDSAGLAAKIPGKPASTPLPPPEPVAESVADTKVPAAPAAQSAQAAEAKAVPRAEPAAAKGDAKPLTTSAPAPAPVAAAPAVDKPAPPLAEKKADAKADAARAKAAVEGAAPGGQWVVQLGAYKDAANVKLLLAKLKGMGVPAYTEHFDSPQGPRTRVRAGPFPSREAAEKARVAKIKKVGVDGPVAPK